MPVWAVRPLDLDSTGRGCKIYLAKEDKLERRKNKRGSKSNNGLAWLEHTVPEHAVGLLFPAGWASSLVDTELDLSVLSWESTNARCLTCTCKTWRHLVCPLSKWDGKDGGSQRQGPRPPVGLAGRQDKGHCVYCVYCVYNVWVCVA